MKTKNILKASALVIIAFAVGQYFRHSIITNFVTYSLYISAIVLIVKGTKMPKIVKSILLKNIR